MGSASRSEVALAHWWTRTVGDRSDSLAREIFDDLLGRHREPHRRYHTASHVLWVLRHVDTLASDEPLDDHEAVFAACFFHDAIYEPTAFEPGANERASAALAVDRLGELGWEAGRTERVSHMIDATATHQLPDSASAGGHDDIDPTTASCSRAGSADTAVLLDADLAILGADASAYGTYVTGVRAEYAHVDDDAWVVGRSAVLDAFLARPAIYATGAGRHRWEARARANLTAELMALRQSPG